MVCASITLADLYLIFSVDRGSTLVVIVDERAVFCSFRNTSESKSYLRETLRIRSLLIPARRTRGPIASIMTRILSCMITMITAH